jgi:ribosomal protein S18 acetylase RimI-like enzyme
MINENKYSITYAQASDMPDIGICHMLSFPDSLTTRLGKRTVVDMLMWYLSAPNKFLFFIKEGYTVIGYCGGYLKDGSDQYGSSSGMTQFGFKSAGIALLTKPWLLLHPEVVKKYGFILKNIARKIGLYNEQTKTASTNNSEGLGTAGLVVIGVHPQWQGKGIGTLLQQEFECKALELGAKRLSLTVKKNNGKAVKSYYRNGYVIYKEEATSFYMVKDLV